jgi:threonyl-tRNA synthetase
VQAVLLTITDRQAEFARRAQEALQNQGFRVEADLRNEKIGLKIREHTLARIPYLLVVGDREAQSQTVAVRTRGGKDLGSMSLDGLAAGLAAESASRGRSSMED